MKAGMKSVDRNQSLFVASTCEYTYTTLYYFPSGPPSPLCSTFFPRDPSCFFSDAFLSLPDDPARTNDLSPRIASRPSQTKPKPKPKPTNQTTNLLVIVVPESTKDVSLFYHQPCQFQRGKERNTSFNTHNTHATSHTHTRIVSYHGGSDASHPGHLRGS